jgi:hypothetical protein
VAFFAACILKNRSRHLFISPAYPFAPFTPPHIRSCLTTHLLAITSFFITHAQHFSSGPRKPGGESNQNTGKP